MTKVTLTLIDDLLEIEADGEPDGAELYLTALAGVVAISKDFNLSLEEVQAHLVSLWSDDNGERV